MLCEKCGSKNIKQTIKKYNDLSIEYNNWCLECGNITKNIEIWRG